MYVYMILTNTFFTCGAVLKIRAFFHNRFHDLSLIS